MTRWAILTGEYPPQPGGVSDYTQLVARGLADAGDHVMVFAPDTGLPFDTAAGINVVGLTDRFGRRGRSEVEAAFTQEKPDRVLVQYVPHAYGRKAMNLPFIRWVTRDLRRIAPLWVMFHEVAFPVRWWPPKHTLLGLVTRRMAARLACHAARVFVSIPAWGEFLQRLCPRAVASEWLPIPCTMPVDPKANSGRPADGQLVVGHFGTYGPLITDLLTPACEQLLARHATATLSLLGRGSEAYRDELIRRIPMSAGRVSASGELSPTEVSLQFASCDLLLQPYPDGVSSRRTSVMAGLANGVPVVTNLGFLSEPLWANGAVAAAPIPDPQAVAAMAVSLLADDAARAELGSRGAELYRQTFALEHTIAALRGTR